MGCDILFFVEVQNNQGTWDAVPDRPFPCRFCHGTGRDAALIACVNCDQKHDTHVQDKCLYGPGIYVEGPIKCTWYVCGGGHEVRPYYDSRNYEFFGALAGVRQGPAKGITIEDRGIPEDVSETVGKYMEDDGLHSRGHYYLNELLAHEAFWRQHHSFNETLDALKELHPDSSRVRIVFAFDS